jgi:outer membrane protein TolC
MPFSNFFARGLQCRYRIRPATLLLALLIVAGSTAASPAQSEARADALVAEALARSPDVAALRAALEAARSRARAADTLPDPMLSGQLAPETLGGFTAPGGGRRSAAGSLSISQRLPWPGTLDLRASAARAEAAARAEDIATLRLSLRRRVLEAWAQWALSHRALAINAEHLALVDALRANAEQRYAAGLAAQNDVLQAETAIEALQRERIALQAEKRRLRARLNALRDRDADAPLPAPSRLPDPSALPATARLREQLAARHPALAELEARLRAAADVEALADKAFYPEFQLTAGHNAMRPAPETRSTIGIALSLPLDRDRRRAERDAAAAESARLRADYRSTRRELLDALEAALARTEAASATWQRYQDHGLPLAEESLDAARAAYDSGGGSFSDVLDAQRALLDAALGTARARAEFLAARAAVEYATGAPPAANGEQP